MYSIRKTVFILFLSLLILPCLAQDEINYIERDCSISVLLDSADMDKDGIMDYLWYECQDTTLVFLLSSNQFEPIKELYENVFDNAPGHHIYFTAHEGGFNINYRNVGLAEEYWSYKYDEKSKKFQFIYYSFNHHKYSDYIYADLETQEFRAYEGSYYDIFIEEYTKEVPEVTIPITYWPIYFGEEEPDFMMLSHDLFEAYRKMYSPPFIKTYRFVSLDFDDTYDYIGFTGITADGETHGGIMACNYPAFEPGDLVQLTYGCHCYQEPGDNSLRVLWGIIDVKILEKGNP